MFKKKIEQQIPSPLDKSALVALPETNDYVVTPALCPDHVVYNFNYFSNSFPVNIFKF